MSSNIKDSYSIKPHLSRTTLKQVLTSWPSLLKISSVKMEATQYNSVVSVIPKEGLVGQRS